MLWIPFSPTCAQSNIAGHAEAAVKAVKHLMLKAAPSGDLASEEFLQGLLKLRNTPDATGFSPAQMVFGHQLRTLVQAHQSKFQPRWIDAMKARDRQALSTPPLRNTTTPAPIPCARFGRASSSGSRTP